MLGGAFGRDLEDFEECKSEEEQIEQEDEIENDSNGRHCLKQRSKKALSGSSHKEQRILRPPSISFGQRCEKHDWIIHSFVRESQELLCTKCIYERNLHSNQIEVFP